jgi:phage gpG-like protein
MADNVSVRVSEGPRVTLVRANARKLDPLLNRIGRYLTQVSRAAFANQRFDGKPWPPRSLPNIAGIIRDLEHGRFNSERLNKSTPALVDTGALRRSIRYRLVGAKSVGVYSLEPYSGIHQEGGTDVIPVTDSVKQNLKGLLKAMPQLRQSLGFLFRKNALSVNVPARPFLGVPESSKARIQEMIDDHLKRKVR